MSTLGATKAKRVCAALLRLGWPLKKQAGSHRKLQRGPGWIELLSRPVRIESCRRARLDRTAFEAGSLDDTAEKEYWRSKTPAERMEALELLRQIVYGYDPTTTRLQRVFEVC